MLEMLPEAQYQVTNFTKLSFNAMPACSSTLADHGMHIFPKLCMQRHAYQQCLLCLGRSNAQTLATASTDNFHKLSGLRAGGILWQSLGKQEKETQPHSMPPLVHLSPGLPSKSCEYLSSILAA